MDGFPAIRVVKGDGGQGIDHVEGLEEGGRENFRFWCNIGVTIAVNQPQRVKSCLSRKRAVGAIFHPLWLREEERGRKKGEKGGGRGERL